MDKSKGSQAEALKWEVFVTPGIPVLSRDRPAGVKETYFQAMASTLIYGKRDALLVDAFMTVEQATALADWVASKNKNLTTIYITHGHGDHLVWSRHSSRAISKRSRRGDAEHHQGDASECVS
jgi:hypothetical protein